MSHTLVLDIGKSHKKCFVFDKNWQIVFEKSEILPTISDEDGDPCEDIDLLTNWVRDSYALVCNKPELTVTHVHATAYGASLVYLDREGSVLTPMYDYHKPYPERLYQLFQERHGNMDRIDLQTASPRLGSLNSGMQFFRLKYDQPELFERVDSALHLPQYITWLLTGQQFNELSSLGCHTRMWDFPAGKYHEWVLQEGLDQIMPPPNRWRQLVYDNKIFGCGVHDSSAALIPYLRSFDEPFILLSTGTWNIALNPFHDGSLTPEELKTDTLCYLTPGGIPVKAARLLAGPIYDEAKSAKASGDEDRYELLMGQLIYSQVAAIRRVLTPGTKIIFVDGGFAINHTFLDKLSAYFPELDWYASKTAQATALGAALLLHPLINVRDALQIKKID